MTSTARTSSPSTSRPKGNANSSNQCLSKVLKKPDRQTVFPDTLWSVSKNLGKTNLGGRSHVLPGFTSASRSASSLRTHQPKSTQSSMQPKPTSAHSFHQTTASGLSIDQEALWCPSPTGPTLPRLPRRNTSASSSGAVLFPSAVPGRRPVLIPRSPTRRKSFTARDAANTVMLRMRAPPPKTKPPAAPVEKKDTVRQENAPAPRVPHQLPTNVPTVVTLDTKLDQGDAHPSLPLFRVTVLQHRPPPQVERRTSRT